MAQTSLLAKIATDAAARKAQQYTTVSLSDLENELDSVRAEWASIKNSVSRDAQNTHPVYLRMVELNNQYRIACMAS